MEGYECTRQRNKVKYMLLLISIKIHNSSLFTFVIAAKCNLLVFSKHNFRCDNWKASILFMYALGICTVGIYSWKITHRYVKVETEKETWINFENGKKNVEGREVLKKLVTVISHYSTRSVLLKASIEGWKYLSLIMEKEYEAG